MDQVAGGENPAVRPGQVDGRGAVGGTDEDRAWQLGVSVEIHAGRSREVPQDPLGQVGVELARVEREVRVLAYYVDQHRGIVRDVLELDHGGVVAVGGQGAVDREHLQVALAVAGECGGGADLDDLAGRCVLAVAMG